MNSKPRSDAALLNLPEPDKSKLRAVLLAGMSYTDACAFTEKEMGVTSARNSMAQFWKHECLPVRLQGRADDAENADAIVSAAAEKPGQFSEAAKQAIHERFYHLSNNPASKPDELTVVNDIIMRDREVGLKERAVSVQEARYALEKQAADLILKDRELAKHRVREQLMRENTKKIVDDEMTYRMMSWSNSLKVWRQARENGQDAGPMPTMDMEQMKADVFAKLGFDYTIPPKTEQGDPILSDAKQTPGITGDHK